jgi:hypothetical protein
MNSLLQSALMFARAPFQHFAAYAIIKATDAERPHTLPLPSQFPFDLPQHVAADPLICLGCSLPLISSQGITGSATPEAGSIALCWECGHVQAFADPPTRYRPLTDAEMVEIAGYSVIVLANNLRAAMLEREALLKAGTLSAFKDQAISRRVVSIVKKMRAAINEEAKEERK